LTYIGHVALIGCPAHVASVVCLDYLAYISVPKPSWS
jgi:hypothetical protein